MPTTHVVAASDTAPLIVPLTSPSTIPQTTAAVANLPIITATAPPTFDPSTAVVLTPFDVGATCQAADGQEADHTPVPFAPTNLFDLNPRTAWRCDAPAIGQRVEIELASTARLTSVGLIPGYDKVDPTSGADRFLENYRVHVVQWSFDDGTKVTQTFNDSRDMQRVNIDATTRHISMQIVDVYDSSYPVGAANRRDYVPVSELELRGVVLAH